MEVNSGCKLYDDVNKIVASEVDKKRETDRTVNR
jgi:hypothetical protein